MSLSKAFAVIAALLTVGCSYSTPAGLSEDIFESEDTLLKAAEILQPSFEPLVLEVHGDMFLGAFYDSDEHRIVFTHHSTGRNESHELCRVIAPSQGVSFVDEVGDAKLDYETGRYFGPARAYNGVTYSLGEMYAVTEPVTDYRMDGYIDRNFRRLRYSVYFDEKTSSWKVCVREQQVASTVFPEGEIEPACGGEIVFAEPAPDPTDPANLSTGPGSMGVGANEVGSFKQGSDLGRGGRRSRLDE